MIGLILILFFSSCVNSQMQSMQYHMQISRKSRSSAAPTETGYVYSHQNNPGTTSTFSNSGSSYNSIPGETDVGSPSDSMSFKYGDTYDVKYSSGYSDSPKKYEDTYKVKYSDKSTNYDKGPNSKQSDTFKVKYSDKSTIYDETPNGKHSDTFKVKFSDKSTNYDESPNGKHSDSFKVKYSDKSTTSYDSPDGKYSDTYKYSDKSTNSHDSPAGNYNNKYKMKFSDKSSYNNAPTVKYGDAYSVEYSDKSTNTNDSPTVKYSNTYNIKYSDNSNQLNVPTDAPKKHSSEQLSQYKNSHTETYDDLSDEKYSDNLMKYKDDLTKYNDPLTKYNDPLTKYNDKLSKYDDIQLPETDEHSTQFKLLTADTHTDYSPSIYTEPNLSKYAVDYAVAKSKVESAPIEKYSDKVSKYSDIPLPYSNEQVNHNLVSSENSGPPVIQSPPVYTEPPMTQYAIDYAIAKSKSEAEYNSKYLPSKIKSDAMYERLKSLMHYSPPPDTMDAYGYNSVHDFHVDDDDIRTSSRSSYDSWPYFYHSPYEYEHMKIDADIEKAKDKRYAVDKAAKIIIPVHENQEHDDNSYVLTTPFPITTTAENPISGNQPFFSFVLNDYFQKTDEDPLTFKGLDLGKDFDYQTEIHEGDNEENGKRNRRLPTKYTSAHIPGNTAAIHEYDNNLVNSAHGESATEKSYNKNHEFDNHEKGDEHKSDHKTGYEHNGNNYHGFKDFVDTFANKFGSEDHKKNSKYLLKTNQDKGEKRKGFRRVYHKDEYQEDNEFYDNTHKSANAEEKGSSDGRIGGSQAFLQSHAAASLGNEANAYNKAGNTLDNKFEKNHSGHKKEKGHAHDLNRYKDVAKKLAQSNSADYIEI